jgi:FtsP/CotA-like multicopper oxidase with cupredoxin domain
MGSGVGLRRRPRLRCLAARYIAAASLSGAALLLARPSPAEPCPRPAPGARIPEPEDLRSVGGVLSPDLAIENYRRRDGTERYCYRTPDGHEAPTLRVRPGDLVIPRLTNHLLQHQQSANDGVGGHQHRHAMAGSNPCTSGAMSASSTNLHFHGMSMPPLCHQDEVLKNSIQPVTYVQLTLLYDGAPQALGVVAIDGAPINQGDASAPRVQSVDHLVVCRPGPVAGTELQRATIYFTASCA